MKKNTEQKDEINQLYPNLDLDLQEERKEWHLLYTQ